MERRERFFNAEFVARSGRVISKISLCREVLSALGGVCEWDGLSLPRRRSYRLRLKATCAPTYQRPIGVAVVAFSYMSSVSLFNRIQVWSGVIFRSCVSRLRLPVLFLAATSAATAVA